MLKLRRTNNPTTPVKFTPLSFTFTTMVFFWLVILFLFFLKYYVWIPPDSPTVQPEEILLPYPYFISGSSSSTSGADGRNTGEDNINPDLKECVLPPFDPWNDVAYKFWNDWKECDAKSTFFKEKEYPFRLGADNRIEVLNEKICDPNVAKYSYINPAPSKNIVILLERYPLSEPIKENYVIIYCSADKDTDKYLFTWPIKKDLTQKKQLITKEKPFNIIGIGFDSMSHANYVRSLPVTLNLMRTKLNKTGNLFELNGYTIVGDGTTANLGGILTGQHEFYLPEARKKLPNSSYVDTWPWIWKEAANAGYITAFLEDEPQHGAFTLRLNGFKEQPTDYYYLNFWQSIGNYGQEHYGMWDWYRQLEYALNIFKSYPDHPTFIFEFSKKSHVPCLTELSNFDDKIAALFDKFFEQPHFENTLFFLFGDHGQRFGQFRKTLEGKIEERLPGMFIKVPDRLAKEHPEIIEQLRINQNRLTTPFDLHATLMDIINYPNTPKYYAHQKSLFKPIESTRTCKDSLIFDHWCSCLSGKTVPVDETIIKGTEELIKVLNNRLNEYGEGKCEKLTLAQVHRAELLQYDPKMVGFEISTDEDGRNPRINPNKKYKSTFDVQFEIAPGGGILEGGFTLVPNERGTTLTIIPGQEFSRVNSYGYLPCEPKPLIREFCSCKL